MFLRGPSLRAGPAMRPLVCAAFLPPPQGSSRGPSSIMTEGPSSRPVLAKPGLVSSRPISTRRPEIGVANRPYVDPFHVPLPASVRPPLALGKAVRRTHPPPGKNRGHACITRPPVARFTFSSDGRGSPSSCGESCRLMLSALPEDTGRPNNNPLAPPAVPLPQSEGGGRAAPLEGKNYGKRRTLALFLTMRYWFGNRPGAGLYPAPQARGQGGLIIPRLSAFSYPADPGWFVQQTRAFQRS